MNTFLSIGSGPGMGCATAARFARDGFQIVLSARDLAKTQEQANRLKAKGYRVDIRTVESAERESVATLISTKVWQLTSAERSWPRKRSLAR